MEFRTIPVSQLMLDVQNPRHEPVPSQREATIALIEDQGDRLTRLGRSIAENGLNPMERMIVLKNGRNYTDLEGNRRLAVLKLFHNPELAGGTELEAAFKELAKEAKPPTKVECTVAPSRQAAAPWIKLRHGGQAEGVGVVPWSALASSRFDVKPGSQAAKAVSLIDTIQLAYPKNESIQADLKTVAKERLTTLGRLVSDPNFKSHVGMGDDSQGHPTFFFKAVDLESSLERLLSDLATDLTVTKIKTKELRSKYIAKLPEPKKSARLGDATALTPSSGATKPRRKPARRRSKPARPFENLDLGNLGERIEKILGEFQKFDLVKFPNAAALILRAIVEFSVDEALSQREKSTSGEFKTRIKRALHLVDPTDKDDAYQAVRTGLTDGTSLLAIATLHGYVHNPQFHPTGSEVRTIAANYESFLAGLNDLVGA
ncbi:MAG: hypothetical protein ACOYD4_00710 [Solirubrobacterales bacterium]